MSEKSLAEQALVEHATLQHVKQALRVALAWNPTSVGLARKLSSVRFTAESLRRHFERLMDLEEDGGYMDTVGGCKPNWVNQVESLLTEHQQFRASLRQIMTRLSEPDAAENSRLAPLCDELTALLDRVDKHDAKELELLQEVLLWDEGGEG